MATNDFLPYAVGGGANVLSQASYAALTTLLANGLSSGIVPSDQLNKTLRQPSIMAAVIGQLIADATGQNAVDDGTIATLEANLARVIRGAAAYAADTGSANAYAIALAPAPASLVAGMAVRFLAGNTNTGASTLNVNGLGAKALTLRGSVALLAGDIQAGAMVEVKYDGTQWQVQNPATLSRVIGVPTNASANTGYVGELISSVVAQGAAVPMVSATPKTITSITLTPGNWNIFGVVKFLGTTTTTMNQISGSTSPTTNTVDDDFGLSQIFPSFTPGSSAFNIGGPVPIRPVSISVSTTYYLVGYCVFTASTLSGYGRITARRVL